MEKKAKLEKSSYELLTNYNGNITKPKKWWKEVNYHSESKLVIKIINLLLNC